MPSTRYRRNERPTTLPSRLRSVLVTGAAAGIGRSCAERFHREGWVVGVLDCNASLLSEHWEGRPSAVILAADVTDQPAISEAVATFADRAGPLDACLNAAGIYPVSSLETANTDLYRRIFDVNVLGTVLVSQACVRYMTSSGGAAIVNFASINAFFAKVDQLLYNAAKAAVVSLTRTMAADLASRQIRVNAVAPGPVETEGMKAVPARLAQIASAVPLGRAATPDEIADLCHWLVTGLGAQYITGETIVASGGLVMR